MCFEKGCTMPPNLCGCCTTGCCKCNYNCFKCSDTDNFKTPNWIYGIEHYGFSDVRNKFVCFPCRRIWKSGISKYICNKANLKPQEIPGYLDSGLTPDEKYEMISKIIDAYRNTMSKCAKCKNDGQYVGRNFRHCKTEKAWKKLEQDVKDKKIDLVKDFYEYPRELTTLK